jgi:chromatin remodeling complex protein RSC6
MPRPTKSTQKSTETAAPVVAVAPAPVATPATAAAVSAKKPRASKKEDAPVVAAPAPVAVVAEVADESAEAKSRVAPTRESIMTEFAELVNLLETEVARLRDNAADKNSGVKFLRGVTRRVKALQASTARVVKQKQPSARKNNNSGFLKPVQISSEIAKFTGLPADQLHSRVEVTKYLCKYIKDKNLQNPDDKRQIVADPALAKILGYDAKTATEPLTYYRLQSLLKNNNHFPTTAGKA